MMDERANVFKVRYLTGMTGRICGGHKRGGESALPGEVCIPATGYPRREGMGMQKSAEGIVGRFDPAEGPNISSGLELEFRWSIEKQKVGLG